MGYLLHCRQCRAGQRLDPPCGQLLFHEYPQAAHLRPTTGGRRVLPVGSRYGNEQQGQQRDGEHQIRRRRRWRESSSPATAKV